MNTITYIIRDIFRQFKMENMGRLIVILVVFWVCTFLAINVYEKVSNSQLVLRAQGDIPVLNSSDRNLLGSPVIFRGEKYYVSEVNYWKYSEKALIHLDKWEE